MDSVVHYVPNPMCSILKYVRGVELNSFRIGKEILNGKKIQNISKLFSSFFKSDL